MSRGLEDYFPPQKNVCFQGRAVNLVDGISHQEYITRNQVVSSQISPNKHPKVLNNHQESPSIPRINVFHPNNPNGPIGSSKQLSSSEASSSPQSRISSMASAWEFGWDNTNSFWEKNGTYRMENTEFFGGKLVGNNWNIWDNSG